MLTQLGCHVFDCRQGEELSTDDSCNIIHAINVILILIKFDDRAQPLNLYTLNFYYLANRGNYYNTVVLFPLFLVHLTIHYIQCQVVLMTMLLTPLW